MGMMARLRALEAATPNTNSVAGTVQASKTAVPDTNKDLATFRNLTATNLKAGSSGVAGTVDVFPSTASKGKVELTTSDNTGNTTTNINVAAQAGVRTLTVPDPGTDAAFLMTQGAQTIVGAQTFSGTATFSGQATFSTMFRIRRATIAAAGTGVLADAAQLVTGFNSVTAADDTKAAKLPATPTAGDIVIVKNVVANKTLPVFPDAAATINAVGSHGAITLAAGVAAIFIADSATQWYTIPLLPS